MKKLIFCLLLAISPLVLFAQQKIAVVNTQELLMGLPESQDAQKRLAELEERYTKEMQTMQEEYRKKSEAFVQDSESGKLSDALSKSRQQELIDMQNRIQQSYATMQQDLEKQQMQLMAPIQQKIADAIRKLGDEKGYTYVMEAGATYYQGKDAIDITPELKGRLGIK